MANMADMANMIKSPRQVPAEPEGGGLTIEAAVNEAAAAMPYSQEEKSQNAAIIASITEAIAKKKADCMHLGHFNDKFKAETTAFFEQLEKEIVLLADYNSPGMVHAGLEKFQKLLAGAPNAKTFSCKLADDTARLTAIKDILPKTGKQ